MLGTPTLRSTVRFSAPPPTADPSKRARPVSLPLMLLKGILVPPGRFIISKTIWTSLLIDLKKLREKCVDLPVEHGIAIVSRIYCCLMPNQTAFLL